MLTQSFRARLRILPRKIHVGPAPLILNNTWLPKPRLPTREKERERKKEKERGREKRPQKVNDPMTCKEIGQKPIEKRERS